MLYQEGVSYEFNKVNTAKLTAHEMSHSWMGNMASFKDYKSNWVKEAFANYLEKFAVSKVSLIFQTSVNNNIKNANELVSLFLTLNFIGCVYFSCMMT